MIQQRLAFHSLSRIILGHILFVLSIPPYFLVHLSNIVYDKLSKNSVFFGRTPGSCWLDPLSCWRNPNFLLLPSWFHLRLCFFQPTFCWLKFKFLLVSPCFTMFHHVSPCFTMFHHVSPCFTMFHHVSPCFTMIPLEIWGVPWSP